MRVSEGHMLDGGWNAVLRGEVRQYAGDVVMGLSA
jgi:hypothetical protein